MSGHQLTSWRTLRAALQLRAGGRCEACGQALSPELLQAHHRQLRSQGGPDCLCNLLALHPWCHTGGVAGPMAVHFPGVHGSPATSYLDGHLVRRHEDPREVPAELATSYGQGSYLLGCDGSYRAAA